EESSGMAPSSAREDSFGTFPASVSWVAMVPPVDSIRIRFMEFLLDAGGFLAACAARVDVGIDPYARFCAHLFTLHFRQAASRRGSIGDRPLRVRQGSAAPIPSGTSCHLPLGTKGRLSVSK